MILFFVLVLADYIFAWSWREDATICTNWSMTWAYCTSYSRVWDQDIVLKYWAWNLFNKSADERVKRMGVRRETLNACERVKWMHQWAERSVVLVVWGILKVAFLHLCNLNIYLDFWSLSVEKLGLLSWGNKEVFGTCLFAKYETSAKQLRYWFRNSLNK